LESELFKSSEENEKLSSINMDLKKLVKTDFRDMNNTDADQTYAELKHKSVIESLDARCEALKRRNNLMKSENELLRSELSVL
jgi:cell division protein FtsB